MDKWEKWCKGCKYFLKPRHNVLCNKTGDSCKRLTLIIIDEKIDYYEKDEEEDGNCKM